MRRAPAGKSPEGDRLWYARAALGKTLDQMVELSGGLINRSNWIGIEKGRLGTSGLKSMSGIAQAFGVTLEQMRAYLDGDFGEPNVEGAKRFLARRSSGDSAADQLGTWLRLHKDLLLQDEFEQLCSIGKRLRSKEAA